MRDFLSLGKLHSIMESVGDLLQNPPPIGNESSEFDPNEYDQFVVDPANVSDSVFGQIIQLIEGTQSGIVDGGTSVSATGIDESVRNAVALVYLTKDNVPVAVAVLVDPTKENASGVIPADYYEMKSGQSLSGRLQQAYFKIHPNHSNKGLAKELRRLIHTVVDNTFVCVPVSDADALAGLAAAGYNKISTFETSWDSVPVTLWIDSLETENDN